MRENPSQADIESLPIQQSRAYAEAAGRPFVSLLDFEASADQPGHVQLERVSILPQGIAKPQFATGVTRTGVGAARIELPVGSQVRIELSEVNDLTPYSLLSLALHSPALRDDLQISLESSAGSWASHRILVQPGWNTVMVDIQNLKRQRAFDVRRVLAVRISLSDQAASETLHIDDLLLIDNRRLIQNAPTGYVLHKSGNNITLRSPGSQGAIQINQSDDGLWRFEPGPVLQVWATGQNAPGDRAEHIQPLGQRRVGQLELLEVNPMRIRLANTWYFPSRSGEWASMAVRQVRWDYCFYADGRCVASMELNNSGGQELGGIRLTMPDEVCWPQGQGAELLVSGMEGPVGRWRWLDCSTCSDPQAIVSNWRKPPQLVRLLADTSAFAEGDRDKDGFDESQGCYAIGAQKGNCRFELLPGQNGLVNPIVRILNIGPLPPSVICDGMPIRDVQVLEDNSALFMICGHFKSRISIEVAAHLPI